MPPSFVDIVTWIQFLEEKFSGEPWILILWFLYCSQQNLGTVSVDKVHRLEEVSQIQNTTGIGYRQLGLRPPKVDACFMLEVSGNLFSIIWVLYIEYHLLLCTCIQLLSTPCELTTFYSEAPKGDYFCLLTTIVRFSLFVCMFRHLLQSRLTVN